VLIPANDPTFEPAAVALSADPIITQLKPFIAVVWNKSDEEVAAFSISWTVFLNNLHDVTTVNFMYPDSVTKVAFPVNSRNNPLPPHATRLLAMPYDLSIWLAPQGSIETIRAASVRQHRQYADATQLNIDVSCVLFVSGKLEGHDCSELRTKFSAYLSAKQALYKAIVSNVDSGLSVDQAFASSEALVSTPPPIVRPSAGQEADFGSEYPRLAAEEAIRWKKTSDKNSSDVITTFRRAILDRPFVMSQ